MKRCLIVGLLAVGGILAGCSRNDGAVPPKAEAAHHHEHHPPHGGTPVELGEEANHVEIVVDAPSGKLRAYVLDGELENFVRISAPSLQVTAKVDGRQETLALQAVANNATGERVGDTSLFEAQADWLKTTPQFDGVLKEITVNNTTYTNVAFNFPKGGDEGATPKP
jgi:hypothetical protein